MENVVNMLTNKDLCFMAVVAILFIAAWAFMETHQAVYDTSAPPLPVNLRTNGNLDGNGMDVASFTNFQQQPYG